MPNFVNPSFPKCVSTYFVKVEDEIQFTHVVKVHIEHFYQEMDHFKRSQLVVLQIDTQSKYEPCISSIYNLLVLELDVSAG